MKEKYEFGETTVTTVVSHGVHAISPCHARVQILALMERRSRQSGGWTLGHSPSYSLLSTCLQELSESKTATSTTPISSPNSPRDVVPSPATPQDHQLLLICENGRGGRKQSGMRTMSCFGDDQSVGVSEEHFLKSGTRVLVADMLEYGYEYNGSKQLLFPSKSLIA